MKSLPSEIEHALKRHFLFPKQSVYAQLATLSGEGPTIRTMRLYDVTSTGYLIFFSHIKTKKWDDARKNRKTAVCLFDPVRKVQMLATGRCTMHTRQSDRVLIERYWNILDEDDKKLYSGPVPGKRLHKKIQFKLPKNIPATFGVMEVVPRFWELLEVSPDYLLRSVRMRFLYTHRGWRKERIVVG